jgi:alpha-ribazole phosphatase
MKLRLLRHPLTTAAAGLCYGRTDVGVLPEATREVAERVACDLDAGTELICSPLQRCDGLARAIAVLQPGLVVRTDARLAEMDFGAWEGRAWSAIDRAEFEGWTREFADTCAGGSGESTRQFMRRVAEAFDDWRDAGSDAVWVTHAGVIRAVWLLHEGIRCVERADQWPSQSIAFGEWVTVEL